MVERFKGWIRGLLGIHLVRQDLEDVCRKLSEIKEDTERNRHMLNEQRAMFGAEPDTEPVMSTDYDLSDPHGL